MSHNVETMAAVGTLPWWGMGQNLAPGELFADRYPDMSTNADGAAQGRWMGDAGTVVSGDEMLQAAGLDWKVELKPACVMLGDQLQVIPNQFAVVRDKDNSPLGVVGKKYTLVQNAELFGVPDVLVGEGKVSYETAGSLDGGRKVWALLNWGTSDIQRKFGQLRGAADRYNRYLLWMASHDGTSSVIGGFTHVRVVCKNTADAAMGVDGRRLQNRISIRHTASAGARMAEAHRTFLTLHKDAEMFEGILQELADNAMDSSQFAGFADKFLDEVQGELDNQHELYEDRKGKREQAVQELLNLFQSGKGNCGADRHDAYSSITEWLDHKHGDYNKARTLAQQSHHMKSTLNGARFKQKGVALKLLRS